LVLAESQELTLHQYVVLALVEKINGERGKDSVVGLLRGSKSRRVTYLVEKRDLWGFYNLLGMRRKADVMDLLLGMIKDELIQIRRMGDSEDEMYPLVYVTVKGRDCLEMAGRSFEARLDRLLSDNRRIWEFQRGLSRVTRKPGYMEEKAEGRPLRHSRAGQKWSEEEEKRLSGAFMTGRNVAELADMLGRKPGGIIARLERLGLVTRESVQTGGG